MTSFVPNTYIKVSAQAIYSEGISKTAKYIRGNFWWKFVYLVQKLIKPSSTPNDTSLKDISHLYNIGKICSLGENFESKDQKN